MRFFVCFFEDFLFRVSLCSLLVPVFVSNSSIALYGILAICSGADVVSFCMLHIA